ncbi:MAG: L-aspartate oxidase [Planctomycetaceae bacterium]
MNTLAVPAPRYLLNFDTRDLPRFTTDLLVIGGGVAGLSAALAAAPAARIAVVMKDPAGGANTAYAQGGIAAALAADDSPSAHAEDTLATGCGLCDRAAVESVMKEAPASIAWLAQLGARFDRVGEGLALGREGGHRARRIVHAAGDATGLECSRVLHEAVQRQPGIQVRERLFLVDLLTSEGRCAGALFRDAAGGLLAYMARATILASGGAGRLYRETTNVRGATGDGIAAAYRAGARLADLEFVQFHPTTLYLAGSERLLVTEAVRGEGARIVDDHGRRFLAALHPDAELAPRDFVSRAIVEQLARPEVRDVFLDMRHWAPGHAARRFPTLVKTCRRYDLDVERDLIPVRPAAHYFIGGVLCDAEGRSSLPGLFVCGEASCSGLHGANRLASNSLLEGLVLGARSGRNAAREGNERFSGEVSGQREARRDGAAVDWEDLSKSLMSRMWRSAGILRDRSGLEEAAGSLTAWRRFTAGCSRTRRIALELENLLLLGSLVVAGARLREESRGTHHRRDHLQRDDERYLGRFVWRNGEPAAFVPLREAVHG